MHYHFSPYVRKTLLISPGMEMRFRSLKKFTAKLPLVHQTEKDWNFPLIGYDTKTNILSGVLLGMVSELDGIILKIC